MRRLIVANTYYQLILAIQMNNTVFIDDEIVLLVSDHSKDSRNIVNEINRHGLFLQCLFIKTKNRDKEIGFIRKIVDCIQIGLGCTNRYNRIIEDIKVHFFDEIICFNLELDIDSYYALLSKDNEDIVVSQYEEGLFSYNGGIYACKRRKLIERLQRINKKKPLMERLTNFYCFYPELYTGSLNSIKIPIVKKDSKTANELKQIFKPRTHYIQKYIFFTSVFDFEGEYPVGEYELVSRIAELVGKENLLVKVHPRDTRTIYRENGFCVDVNSSIPWEAIQLSADFSEKVFMTINSGSVLAGSLMSERPVRTYYMFRLCDVSRNEACKKSIRDIERLLNQDRMKGVLRTVKIAEKLNDIL